MQLVIARERCDREYLARHQQTYSGSDYHSHVMHSSICRAPVAIAGGRAAARPVSSRKAVAPQRSAPRLAQRVPKARPQWVCSAASPGAEGPGEMSELQRIQANDQLLDVLLACKSQEEVRESPLHDHIQCWVAMLLG